MKDIATMRVDESEAFAMLQTFRNNFLYALDRRDYAEAIRAFSMVRGAANRWQELAMRLVNISNLIEEERARFAIEQEARERAAARHRQMMGED